MFDKFLTFIETCLRKWLLEEKDGVLEIGGVIQVDDITREEAARILLEREITIKYQPTIIEFDRKPTDVKEAV